MSPLNGWENFYVIVGSSAGALIGLQFVVITLIADRPIARGEAQAGDAFATPIVVHFGVVLLLSALVIIPLTMYNVMLTCSHHENERAKTTRHVSTREVAPTAFHLRGHAEVQ